MEGIFCFDFLKSQLKMAFCYNKMVFPDTVFCFLGKTKPGFFVFNFYFI